MLVQRWGVLVQQIELKRKQAADAEQLHSEAKSLFSAASQAEAEARSKAEEELARRTAAEASLRQQLEESKRERALTQQEVAIKMQDAAQEAAARAKVRDCLWSFPVVLFTVW